MTCDLFKPAEPVELLERLWTYREPANGGGNPVQSGADQPRRETTDPSGIPDFSGDCPLGSVTVRSGPDTDLEAAGIEPPTDSLEKQGIPTVGAAKSAAVPETDPLAALLAALTPEQRARLGEMLLNDTSKPG
jgi:hypothetical protein